MYNRKYNDKNYKRRSAKYHSVRIEFNNDYYDAVLKPAADTVGLPVGTFIKQIISDYLNKF